MDLSFYVVEIDRLVGEGRELRIQIGALDFEVTRLRRELEGGGDR